MRFLKPRTPLSLRLSTLIFAALLLFVQAISARADSAEEFVADAEARFAEEDVTGGIIQLKNALQEDADYHQARRLLGHYYLQIGDGFNAENELRKVRLQYSNSVNYWEDLATALLIQRKFGEALQELDRASVPSDQMWKLEVLRAKALMDQNATAKAKIPLQRALRSEAVDSSEVHLALANIALIERDPPAFKTHMEALKDAPKSARLSFLQGEWARQHDQNEEAQKKFQQALELDPTHMPSIKGLASLALVDNNLDQAATYIKQGRQVVERDPGLDLLEAMLLARKQDNKAASALLSDIDNRFSDVKEEVLVNSAELQLIRGLTLFLQEKYASAIPQFKGYLQLRPQHHEIRRMEALAHFHLDKPGLAIAEFEKLPENFQTHPQVASPMAKSYLRLHQPDSAEALLDKAIRRTPSPELLELKAGSLAIQGKQEEAVELLEMAREGDSETVDYKLAVLLMQLGETAAARVKSQQLVTQNPTLSNLNLAASASILSGDWNAAESLLDQALKQAPQHKASLANLGELYYRQKRYDEALDTFKRLYDLGQKDPYVLHRLIEVLEPEQPAEALLYIQELLAITPKDASLRLQLTRLYLGARLPDKALATSDSLRSDLPLSPTVYDLRARAFAQKGDLEKAREEFKVVYSLVTGSCHDLLQVASAQLNLQDYQGTLASIERCLKNEPDHPDAQDMLVQLAIQQNDFERVESLASTLSNRGDPSLPHIVAGARAIHEKRDRDALHHYRNALDKTPSKRTLEMVADLTQRLEGPESTISLYQDWLAQHPKDFAATYRMARLLSDQNRTDEAIQAMQRYLELNPADATAFNNLAYFYKRQQDMPAATKAARSALRFAPDSAPMNHTLGNLLLQNAPEEAIPYLEKAYRLAPDREVVVTDLAEAYVKVKDKSKSRALLIDVNRLQNPALLAKVSRLLKPIGVTLD